MAILNVTAVVICLLLLAYFWKESLVEVWPVVVCGLVLVLYVLAMLHHLSWIDGIGILLILGFAIWIFLGKEEERMYFGKACLNNVIQPSFITAIFLLIVVGLCTAGKVVTWWDDVNFWATDVKSLYYLDGFAKKYGNVAPEFGDYPPGAQLIKWWFLHLNPREFREGLAFAGYYIMNLSFMLPVFRKMKGRNVPVMFLMAAALWFLPSIAEVYGYDGFCADLTMACIYGGFLFAVTEKEGKKESIYYTRLGLYLSVLVLIKSVGFIWAVFGLVFLCLYQHQKIGECAVKEETGKRRSRNIKIGRMLAVAAAPVVTGGSWMLFCLLMRRVTKTTTTAVKYITTDEYGISGYTGDFAKAFVKAFFGSPLHKENGPLLDLTPFAFYLCICLLVLFFYRKKLMPQKQGRLILWFSVISGALFYGIIFLAHITIFATETQYLEASGMISSIERYGAPFTIGTLLFLANIWMSYGGKLFVGEKIPPFVTKYGTSLCLILFVALTAGYQTGYHGLIGYREEVTGQLEERAEMIDEDAALFLEKIQVLGTKESTRVCYVQRDDTPRWVKNSYTNLEASPVSVVYKSLNLNDAQTEWMVEEIRTSHAEYLYVEHTEADAAAVFDILVTEGSFACETLYRIADDGGQMKLVRMP
ncbi:MAG: hypothetical protein PUD93_11855 [Lachnospiraceae bacterium]|nr:hypothetical protein [Lachnospiraceae bacterium]